MNVNGILYFAANDGAESGGELWKSDPNGDTSLVADINSGAGSSSPTNLVNVNGTLFFLANDGGGLGLWKSDAGGTVAVRPAVAPVNPRSLVKVGNGGFFIAGTTGRELWKSDGTAGGTVQVRGWTTGPGLANLVDVNGRLFFTTGSMAQNELWKSDGDLSNTELLKTFGVSLGQEPRFLVNVAGTLFFAASGMGGTVTGTELWKSDGTAGGTVGVRDISPGSSNPSFLFNANGTLYFIASDGVHGPELWKSNGTDLGTELVKDIYPYPSGGSAGILGNVGTRVYLVADDNEHGRELWKSDGTEATTVMVRDINPPSTGGSTPKEMVGMNGKLYFSSSDGVNGTELWRSDATEAGTEMVANIYPGSGSSNPGKMVELDGKLYFPANDQANGTELWSSDGTGPGTSLFTNIHPTASSSPASLVKVGSTLFFTADDGTHGWELWKTDGTLPGTGLVADIYPGIGPSGPSALVEMNGKLYFKAADPNPMPPYELWECYEDAPGLWAVRPVKNISPSYLVNVNGTLFFAADSITPPGAGANALWRSDGTTPGTVMLRAWGLGLGLGPQELVNVNGTLFFSANSDRELWKSDGTAPGTVRVADINPGLNSSNPHNLVSLGSKVFFAADQGTGSGVELWMSDGTSTALAADINLSGSSEPMNLVNVDGMLYFSADDGVNGRELWKFDPGELKAEIVQDLMPGPAGSDPGAVVKVGQTLFFAATNAAVGAELFALDLWTSPAGVWVSDQYSSGSCGGHQWGYDAFDTIQAGVDAVADGGTVHITTGTYTGDVAVNKAVTLPIGSGPCQVTINGNLTLSGGTTLEIELAGTTPGTGHDQWVINGSATLAGTVVAALNGDFYPEEDGVFPILTATACTGSFAEFFYPSNDFGAVLNSTATGADIQVVNVRPVIPAITDRTIDEATLFSLPVNAIDADTPAQTLTYTLTNSPAGAAVSATGEITWTPTEAEGPMTSNITVCVSDDGTPNLTVSRTFQVVVNELNVVPALTLPPNQAFDEQTAFSASATATDSDLPANALEFGLVSGPEGLTVSPGGAMAWTPTEAQGSNIYTITIRVTDNNPGAVNDQNLSTISSFELTVNEVNRPPVIGTLADRSVDAGQTLSFTATATDSDLPANALTFSLLSPPTGATIEAGSGLFNWRPGVALADTTNMIQVCVADDGSPFLSDTNSFLVIVNALSGSAVLTPISWSLDAFTFSITGPIGPDYIIQRTGDWTTWTRLWTNTPVAVPFTFTDTNAAGFSSRFYRVLLGP